MTPTVFSLNHFWNTVFNVDIRLDRDVSTIYLDQPLAQDWARVSKVIEELGEAIAELISWTGQNPRKPQDSEALGKLLAELADVSATAILAIQHFTKDPIITKNICESRMSRIGQRIFNLESERIENETSTL